MKELGPVLKSEKISEIETFGYTKSIKNVTFLKKRKILPFIQCFRYV